MTASPPVLPSTRPPPSTGLPVPLQAEALRAVAGIGHGFFTRQGGVSRGLYASLNCGLGSADDRASVAANRALVARAVGVEPDCLATPYQVHGRVAVVVEAPWSPGDGPRADAVVTRRRGLAVGVGTADCGPVLFADGEAGVVAAAHAGWRGATGGILDATVEAMESLGASRSRVIAVLGPTISQRNYEVGPEFPAPFLAEDAGNTRLFRPSHRPDHFLFDLPAYIVGRLQRIGVGRATALDLCTYADEARFFSFRRATHRGEPDYGRLLSAIALV